MGKSSPAVVSTAMVSVTGSAADVAASPAAGASGVVARARVGTSSRPAPSVSPSRRLAGPARRQVCPVPTGPGRAVRRPARPVVGSVASFPPARVAGRAAPVRVAPRGLAARRVPPRPVAAGVRVVAAESRWSAIRQFLAVALAAAVVVGGLGLLADGARDARVPSAVGTVEVHPGESLWQVARRVAPSADPDAVVARMVELNHLVSPSVPDDSTVLSPIG